MRLLVVGAYGMLGREVVAAAGAAGHNVDRARRRHDRHRRRPSSRPRSSPATRRTPSSTAPPSPTSTARRTRRTSRSTVNGDGRREPRRRGRRGRRADRPHLDRLRLPRRRDRALRRVRRDRPAHGLRAHEARRRAGRRRAPTRTTRSRAPRGCSAPTARTSSTRSCGWPRPATASRSSTTRRAARRGPATSRPRSITLAESGATGIFHAAGGGRCTWFDLAAEAVAGDRLDCRVEPTTTRGSPARPRARPISVLVTERGADAVTAPWQEGLAGFLADAPGTDTAKETSDEAARHAAGPGSSARTSSGSAPRRATRSSCSTSSRTRAGEENLQDVERHLRPRRDRGPEAVATAIAGVDAVVNFAAETHVDRSIAEPDAFVKTHAVGTFVLLEAARERGLRYLQVSTDEVYGSIEEGSFTEESPLRPSSPVQRDEDRRRPARAVLRAHVRHADRHLPRLEQLRPAPVPREAHPADRAERPARRPAPRLRRRHAGPQLDPRARLQRRHPPRARARRRRRGLQRRRARRVPEHRRRASGSSRSRAPTSR